MKQSSAHLQLILKALLQAGRRLHFTLLASFMALIFSWGKSQAASYSSNVLGALPPGSEDDDADLFGISEGKLLQFLPADDSTLHGLGISREELNADSIYLSDLNSDGSTDLIYLGESGVDPPRTQHRWSFRAQVGLWHSRFGAASCLRRY